MYVCLSLCCNFTLLYVFSVLRLCLVCLVPGTNTIWLGLGKDHINWSELTLNEILNKI